MSRGSYVPLSTADTVPTFRCAELGARSATGHFAFRAPAPRYTGRAGLIKDEGGHFPDQAEHLIGNCPKLPLRTITASQLEEVPELTGIHGDRDLGGACIGQYISGVFFGHSLTQELILLPYMIHQRPETPCRLFIFADALRHHIVGAILPDISL